MEWLAEFVVFVGWVFFKLYGWFPSGSVRGGALGEVLSR